MTTNERRRLGDALDCAAVTGSAAIRKHGYGAQMLKAVEELGELSTALARYLSPLPNVKHDVEAEVVEELADVLVVAMQLATMMGAEAVIGAVKAKTERLEQRLGQ